MYYWKTTTCWHSTSILMRLRTKQPMCANKRQWHINAPHLYWWDLDLLQSGHATCSPLPCLSVWSQDSSDLLSFTCSFTLLLGLHTVHLMGTAVWCLIRNGYGFTIYRPFNHVSKEPMETDGDWDSCIWGYSLRWVKKNSKMIVLEVWGLALEV